MIRRGGVLRDLINWRLWKAVLILSAFLLAGQALVVRIWHPRLQWPIDDLVRGAIVALGFGLAAGLNFFWAYRDRNKKERVGKSS